VENGKDLTGFMMVAFGGGAPLHATRLMDKLGLDELLVPPGAGVGSAIGFLQAPFAYEAIRSFYTSTGAFDHEGVNRVLAELEAEAESFVRQGIDVVPTGEAGIATEPELVAEPELTVERSVAMRYKGQGWEIPVALAPGAFDQFAAEMLTDVFTKAYEEFFGRAIDDVEIEAVSWSVRVASVIERPEPVRLVEAERAIRADRHRSIYDPATGARAEAAIVERDDLAVGDAVAGPAVIVEQQTTTVLGARHRAVVQADRSLYVTRTQD
jgi:N-methylhydantoinase A